MVISVVLTLRRIKMQNVKISLKNISKIVWYNIIVIVIATLLFGLVGGLYAKHKRWYICIR